ncbi:MAG: hypothetical protein JXQ27_12810 [Acidobacteria bacterium]|nr:hypothetical protein [Acidobacteriota bacterium]
MSQSRHPPDGRLEMDLSGAFQPSLTQTANLPDVEPVRAGDRPLLIEK